MYELDTTEHVADMIFKNLSEDVSSVCEVHQSFNHYTSNIMSLALYQYDLTALIQLDEHLHWSSPGARPQAGYSMRDPAVHHTHNSVKYGFSNP